MNLDNTYNKLQTLGEYVDDTEDYVRFEIDTQRNRFIEVSASTDLPCCGAQHCARRLLMVLLCAPSPCMRERISADSGCLGILSTRQSMCSLRGRRCSIVSLLTHACVCSTGWCCRCSHSHVM